ncbi:MAG: lactonase family protein, partial [Actinomycetota bacterium]
GRLTRAEETAVDGVPGSLTTDAARRHLFVALRGSGKLASYRIDAATGRLTLVSLIPVQADPSYVGVDHSGKFLLSAFYQAGKVMVHRIGPEGALDPTPATQVVTAPTAHSAVPDPSNRRVFVPHVAPNAVFQFAFDAATGRLAPLGMARAMAPAGAGPRHLRLHPTGKWAYTSDESGNSVTQYALDPIGGMLSALETLSTLPPGFPGSNSCAEVKIHPSGRFLYVSNRGHDSIAAFAVNGENGRLTALGQTATEKTPRSFDLDPSGRFLFAAGEGGTRLATYAVDGQTGRLTAREVYEVGKKPFWVLLVATP